MAKRATKTHPRINHRGEVWCFACDAYLPATAFRPPKQYPSWDRPRYWSYCRSCTQAKDRQRYAERTATPEGLQRDLEKRYARKRRQRNHEWQERRAFAADAILQIRKRGLTKSEIARLTGISLATILDLERKQRHRPDDKTVRRLELLYGAVVDWPKRSEPEYRRRLPHPLLPELERYMASRIVRFPLRSRWNRRAA